MALKLIEIKKQTSQGFFLMIVLGFALCLPDGHKSLQLPHSLHFKSGLENAMYKDIWGFNTTGEALKHYINMSMQPIQ